MGEIEMKKKPPPPQMHACILAYICMYMNLIKSNQIIPDLSLSLFVRG